MPSFDVVVSCPVHDSFRVQQVAGMFDVPLAEKSSERFQVELPTDADDWQIGLIVGPSGSGKSTVARHAFRQELYQAADWPRDRAVVDCFGDLPVRRVVELFTAVGFGSPPSWIKPYHVLSCGEQFRCELAKALGARGEALGNATSAFQLAPSASLVVFDEFTSVVDRTVAKVCSAAIAKGIYRPHAPREVVDLLWSLFLGLVHLSETRKNLGVTISTLKDLHRKAFAWFEEGLRL